MFAPRVGVAAVALVSSLFLAGCPRRQDRPDAGPPPCVPLTCAGEGKDCGEIDDGCGGRIFCGTCADGLTCGAAGPNTCGGSCRAGCPRGFTCNARGQCEGGDAGDLRLDLELQAFTVSGRITRDGGTPGACTEARLVERTGWPRQVAAAFAADCGTGDFSGLAYPGTYLLEGTGLASGSVFPTDSLGFVADPALAISADVPGLAIDMGTVNVSGQLTANGLDIAGPAYVAFVDAARGQRVVVDAYSGPFSARLYPGTYRVEVKGTGTEIPDDWYAVSQSTVISGDLALPLDVPVVQLSGHLTINGARFTPTPCSPAWGAGDVILGVRQLDNPRFGHSIAVKSACADASFSAPVYADTYSVFIRGTGSGQDIPYVSALIDDQLAIPASGLTGYALEVPVRTVSGQVTVGGTPLVASASCTDQGGSGAAELSLFGGTPFEGGLWNRYTAPVKCDGTYSIRVLSGSYGVTVSGTGSSLPKQGVRLADPVTDPLVIGADMAALTLDVPAELARTVAIAGRVLRNGVPVVPVSCRPGYGTAGVTFRHSDGTELSLSAGCGSSYYSGLLRPGAYTVTVQGRDSDLPPGEYELPLARYIASANASLDLDVPVRTVSGAVTLNGRAPLPTALCGGQGVGAAELQISDLRRDLYRANVDCAAGTFSLSLYPEAYRVFLQGRHSDLPSGPREVITRLAVP